MAHGTPSEFGALPPGLQARLDAAGLRRTLTTRAVLGIFAARPQALLSHAEVMALLQARGLDANRVTLYRLLDRLTACSVLSRQIDAATRLWRYGLAEPAAGPQDAPRFECDACHQRFELAAPHAPAQGAAADLFRLLAGMGHRELSIHGICAHCAEAPPKP